MPVAAAGYGLRLDAVARVSRTRGPCVGCPIGMGEGGGG